MLTNEWGFLLVCRGRAKRASKTILVDIERHFQKAIKTNWHTTVEQDWWTDNYMASLDIQDFPTHNHSA